MLLTKALFAHNHTKHVSFHLCSAMQQGSLEFSPEVYASGIPCLYNTGLKNNLVLTNLWIRSWSCSEVITAGCSTGNTTYGLFHQQQYPPKDRKVHNTGCSICICSRGQSWYRLTDFLTIWV